MVREKVGTGQTKSCWEIPAGRQSASVWEAHGSRFLIVKDSNWLAKWKQWNLLVGLWVTSRLSWKSGEPGPRKGLELGRLNGPIHSNGHVPRTVCLDTGHSLRPITAATTGPLIPYSNHPSKFKMSQLIRCKSGCRISSPTMFYATASRDEEGKYLASFTSTHLERQSP